MRFEKWQGTGNHHIVVERDAWPLSVTPERARLLCDPSFGIGADGLLEISWEAGTPRMTVWNGDGSIAENCGNGIRIIARYLSRDGRLPEHGHVLTGGGTTTVRVRGDAQVEVDMGTAVFTTGESHETLKIHGVNVAFADISMGNPHAVIDHPDPAAVVRTVGPQIETDPRFPKGTNVEFVRADGPSTLEMRVWERGVGETLACGTGACAAAVAGVRLSDMRSPVTVRLLGGDLLIDVDDNLEVTMTGPAEPVFAGELSPAMIATLEAL